MALSYFLYCSDGYKCKINWEIGDPEKLKHCTVLSNSSSSNLQQLAYEYDSTKLYGYLTFDKITALKELCRILVPCNSKPKLYFFVQNRIVSFEFHPGTEIIITSINGGNPVLIDTLAHTYNVLDVDYII